MLSKKSITIIGISLLILGIFCGGYFTYPHFNHCPKITSDTTYIHDTIPHYIPSYYPWYIQGKDSIIHDTIPSVIDTTFILQDYFNKHVYNRKWENDTLKVLLTDTISKNKPIGNNFHYVIKTPFTTVINKVDNSITYNRYITFGFDIPIKNIHFIELEGIYNYEKGYMGLGYTPELKSVDVKMGVNIIKFKKRK